MITIDDVKFDSRGLVPAVVVDSKTKQVLTLAYMNRESLEITIAEKRTCFWSRSRQKLWRKGETSENIQHVLDITADCDKDALVVTVSKEGPACHTGSDSCFFNNLFHAEGYSEFSIKGLEQLIATRKTEPAEGSYTSYLFNKGMDKILKKIGEEATEVVIAGKDDDRAETIYEIADLAYHVLVLMIEMGITTDDITKELASRHIIDHKVKQEKMTSSVTE